MPNCPTWCTNTHERDTARGSEYLSHEAAIGEAATAINKVTVTLEQWEDAVTGEMGEPFLRLGDVSEDDLFALHTAERLARLVLCAVEVGRAQSEVASLGAGMSSDESSATGFRVL